MATTIPIIDTFVGDSSPDLIITVNRDGEGVVDLTGCSATLKIIDRTTGLPTNGSSGAACSLSDPAHGVVNYTRLATDIPDEGMYRSFLKITYPSGRFETAEIWIKARSAS